MKTTTKKTLIAVLLSFLKWLLGIGKQHIEDAENQKSNDNKEGV